ncbi:stage III sporulation protein AG [Paenibacillus sp. N4]|uniref:stage III sporulation protein AG n=1 Tax=Paenibacillus vietnamensis TaxID=2590547 RepID=UPI001CD10892|nr:stage III sporulation protein AG [Paenibacillus vietnamensis]MCA0754519.1 stage III sporulation protein AG [Paenibacillus vietnamensis]
MAKWLEGIESAVGGGPGGPKRVRTLRLLLIVGLIGAALMIMNSFLTYNDVEPSAQDPNPPPLDEDAWGPEASPNSPFAAIEQPLEQRLKDILEKIVGVGSVDVLVTIDSTEEIVVKEQVSESESVTEENDRNGGKRYITSKTREGKVVIYEVSGQQKPIITKTINPRIRGILIVAKGAENATVRRLLVSAVEKGVSVPVNRIEVVPSKQ